MDPTAVVFDIGGVLEHHGDSSFASRWERRLGLAPGELFARMRKSGLGHDGNLGGSPRRSSAGGSARCSSWTGGAPPSCSTTSGPGTRAR
jgi:hypothetical protein